MATELAIAERNQAPLQRRQETTVDPFEPNDWKGLLELATMISRTQFAPKDFMGKPEACAIAMMYGKQLGIGGLQAIQNIAVINGRPSLYGDAFWAIILSHPEFVDVEEKDEDTKAYVKLTRRGRTPKEVTFTQADAQKAGLWGKAGPWTQYPKTMLLWRARTFAARALFPDALKGITSNYEAEDSGPIIDAAMPEQATEHTTTSATQSIVPPAKITQDAARKFGQAWKASGFTIDQAKEALKRICGVEASLDITVDKIEAAMQWATKNPNWPNAAEISTDEKLAKELFGILGYDLTKQADAIAKFTKDGNTDWVALSFELNKELPAE